MLRRLAWIVVVLVTGAVAAGDESPDQVVLHAQQLAAEHRYQEAVALLEPLESTAENTNLQYIVSAELGRSLFHLGRYQEAHARFQRAVSIEPRQVETALYLQATAYLLGEKEQAWLILREILKSGAKDLYLAVSLPGERKFLTDPDAWALIEEFAVPIGLDLETGSAFGLALGASRPEVAAALGVGTDSAEGKALTAHAGPHMVWGFAFDGSNRLVEIVLQVENLIKYTPYRLGFGGSDWRASPAELGAILGPPTASSTDAENVLVMSWTRSDFTVSAAFGHPRQPRPPGIAEGVAMLKMIRVRSHGLEQSAGDPISDSMNP
jgi:hypothetical protein